MLTCRELVEMVTDYLEGALPPDRHAELVAHLEGCEDCLRYLAQLQATRQVLASVPLPTLADHARTEAVDAFREWCATTHEAVSVRRPWWRRWRRVTDPH
jgi:anti-sigma factor RsiW